MRKLQKIKTFEQFNFEEPVERIDEIFGLSDGEKILSFVEDIQTGKLKKVEKLKKTFLKLRDKKTNSSGRKQQIIKNTQELSKFLDNPEKIKLSEQLEKEIATVVVNSSYDGKAPIQVPKKVDGKWETNTKSTSHGTNDPGKATPGM